ncbi:MAG: hypothetical protein PHH68_08190 [Candidatus Omnitrophica bacterium]|jgi:hypothetical protein|nr:hypothetical protein [Candidatus Omnitrophota bacterium]MDD5078737.1 hypothetical protein [Candidatus Omnitrophota bacterium]MDD5080278.1 hypothetical protein [Candidatus Omnitrophota bacterium]
MANVRSKNRFAAVIACAIFLFGTSVISFAAESSEKTASGLFRKEILVKLDPGVIAMPMGEVARIPISGVRVRSSDLRALNTKYNAVSIEKIYEVKEKGALDEPLKLKGMKTGDPGAASNVKKAANPDLAKIFPREDTKVVVLAPDKEFVESSEIFFMQFELNPGVVIEDMLAEYRAVPVVLYADVITRKAKNEK